MTVAPEQIREAEENGVVKLTVALPTDAVELLRKYAEKHGTTLTEALVRIISFQRFLDQQDKVIIEDKFGRLKQVRVD